MKYNLVDVAESGFLDGRMFDDFTKNTTVSTTDDENLLRIGMGVHGEVCDHLLVPIVIQFGKAAYENSSRSVA